MRVLSVVCARAGSKGLRNKCVQELGGRMLAEYAVEYSLSLGPDVDTVVSTDIPVLIETCRKLGVRCIERDAAICRDDTSIYAALADALKRTGGGHELCSLVYGNIPTRYPALFRGAREFLESRPDYDAVLSMQNVEKFNPAWMFRWDEDVLPRTKELAYRRQELPQMMIHDGHTMIFRSVPVSRRLRGEADYDREALYGILGPRIKPWLSGELIIDIDAERDLRLAEAWLKLRRSRAGDGHAPS